MYSNADIEMWYDWDMRLKDTKWTDQCYFLILDGKKIGGAVVTNELIMFPFLISPFNDRVQFWNYLLKHSSRKIIRGVLDVDSSILPMFNYKAMGTRQVMCRPSDVIETILPDDFICRPLDMDADAAAYGTVFVESHTGGICFEKYGVQTQEEVIAEVAVLPQYQGRGFAKHMIGQIVTQAYGLTPFVKLGVDIGNISEFLYRQMGFIAGPRFTKMERRT